MTTYNHHYISWMKEYLLAMGAGRAVMLIRTRQIAPDTRLRLPVVPYVGCSGESPRQAMLAF